MHSFNLSFKSSGSDICNLIYFITTTSAVSISRILYAVPYVPCPSYSIT